MKKSNGVVRCTRQNSLGAAQVSNRCNWRNTVDTTYILSLFYFHSNSKMPVILTGCYLNVDTINKELESYVQLCTICLFIFIKENFWLCSRWVTYLQSQQLWSSHECLFFVNVLDCKDYHATSEPPQLLMWTVGSLVEYLVSCCLFTFPW